MLEFGCGAGQWAAALVEEGAEVVGIDLSERQLAHARHRRGDLRLVQAAGQYLPFAPSSFDVVFCDHGAMSWADPTATVPEVTRVLRPGGRFVFNVTSPVLDMCWDDEVGGPGRLVRADYFGLHRDVDQDGATSYSLGYGEWIRLFRASGLAIEDLIEPRPASVRPNTYWNSDPPDWFRRWPGESIWITRLES